MWLFIQLLIKSIYLLSVCSKLFTNSNGTLRSVIPSRYEGPRICTYAVRLKSGTRVMLVFQNVSLSHYDMETYDGRDASAAVGLRVHWNYYKTYLSSGNEIFIKNDIPLRIKGWYGFQLQYFEIKGKNFIKYC